MSIAMGRCGRLTACAAAVSVLALSLAAATGAIAQTAPQPPAPAVDPAQGGGWSPVTSPAAAGPAAPTAVTKVKPTSPRTIAAKPGKGPKPVRTVAVAALAPAPATLSNEDLMRNLYCMEQRVKVLEAQLPGKGAAAPTSPPAGSTDVQITPIETTTLPKSATDVPAPGPAPAPGPTPAPEAAATPPGPNTTGLPPMPPVAAGTKKKKAAAAPPPVDPCLPGPRPQTATAGKPLAANPDLFKLPTSLPALPGAAAPGSPGAPTPPAGGLAPLPPLPGTPAAPGGVVAGNTTLFALPGLPGSSSPGPGGAVADPGADGLKFGAYGEIKFGLQQNPNANGQWQNGFDLARFVLLPTYQITNNIIFNAEIEFEHGGSGFDADDKLHGTAEVEQLFIDFRMIEEFNFRAPGLDLVPFGWINEHHEPVLFYSVERPTLDNALIPTTWRVPSTSIYGKIVDGLKYRLQVSTSIEDFGDDFSKRTSANTVPPLTYTLDNKTPPGSVPVGYAAGIDGANALGFSRPASGSFAQLSNTIAAAGQLAYTPSFLPGFDGTTSFYYTPNTTPRGAYADTAYPGPGLPLGENAVFMYDTEFRYRPKDTKFEFRAEFVHVSFSHPENLRANNDSDPTNNVGKSMYGYSGEIAYHHPLGVILGSEWEAVPFYRFTRQNLQTSGFAGTDENLPTGQGKRDTQTAGIAVFPSPKVVMKLDYTRETSKEQGGPKSDTILGGLGFHF